MQQCQACGGTYNATQNDGTLYFHVCPPLSVVELTAAVAAGAVVLPKGETAKDAIGRRTYERASKRDENVTGAPRPKDGPAPIKSAGAGVVEVADVNTAPVVVATASPVAAAPLPSVP